MKILRGYLIDRQTGLGIGSKDVSFLKLNGTAVTTADSYAQSVFTQTDGNGKFEAWFELSPGPVNVVVDAIPGVEVKVRKSDELSQASPSWFSDISRFARGFQEGFINNFLNEMAVTIGPGHQINIATGAAIFNGSTFSIENGPLAIAGTANPAGPANPRYDLITLRQYNADAAGQLAGQQDIIVTLGTTSAVAPATPTGSTFKDLPLWVVSTPLGSATKTLVLDKRTYTTDLQVHTHDYAETDHTHAAYSLTSHTHAAYSLTSHTHAYAPTVHSHGFEEKYGYISAAGTGGPIIPATTAWQTWTTVAVTGLDPAKTYDGEVEIHTTSYTTDNSVATPAYLFRTDNAADKFALNIVAGLSVIEWHTANLPLPISFTWPIEGVTGVTSHSINLQFKNSTAAVPGWNLMPYGWAKMTLRSRT
jgi:hypothetical protein